MIGSVTLRMYLNKTPTMVRWTDPYGREKSLGPGRGGSFAPSEELAQLVARGLVEEVVQKRGGYEGPLPRSTDRRIPF
jgi:hypothetical protein